MKSIALLLCLTSNSAFAFGPFFQTDASVIPVNSNLELVLTGPTARQIFEALEVPDQDDVEEAISHVKVAMGMVCTQESFGAATITTCQSTLQPLLGVVGTIRGRKVQKPLTISFSGPVAQRIYDFLEARPVTLEAGTTQKTRPGISCTTDLTANTWCAVNLDLVVGVVN